MLDRSEELESLRSYVDSEIDEIDRSSRNGDALYESYDLLSKRVADFQRTAQYAPLEIPEATEVLKSDLEKTKDIMVASGAQTTEIIKRVSIGLLVVSFFLAILRYTARIYQAHHLEVLKASGDDLLIRKFYVALKSRANNDADRTVLISSFFGTNSKEAEIDSVGLSGKEIGVIKELLGMFSKKI